MGKSEGVNTTVSTFEDLQVARDWIALIEGEPGRIREQDIYPRIKAWSEGFKPPEVLEIGCGQGICSQQLSSAARQYTGVELSVPLLARAQQLYSGPERKFILGSALALPFPTGRFAGAFSVTVWFLLSDIKQASRELSRILMPGGQFLILTANPQGYANWTSRYTHSKIEGRRFEGRVALSDQTLVTEVFYLHTQDEIVGALEAAGLEVQGLESFRPSRLGPEAACRQDVFLSIQGRKT